eukprot:5758958-Pleurochrysis_carterae.AAC.1
MPNVCCTTPTQSKTHANKRRIRGPSFAPQTVKTKQRAARSAPPHLLVPPVLLHPRGDHAQPFFARQQTAEQQREAR